MWIFYVLALIPIAIGGVLWYLDPIRIVWREWVLGLLISLLLACHLKYSPIFGPVLKV